MCKIDINYKYYYEYNEPKYRTRMRLQEIIDLGLTVVGVAQFGIEGLMSGLYIEKVWNMDDEEWDGYMDWVKELKERKL